MGATANQDAFNALEGKTGGSSLADAAAAEADSPDRRLEAELKSMKEQNKVLILYINKIIERLLQHQDFESILDQSGDMKPPRAGSNKELPRLPTERPQPSNGPSLLQRAKSLAVGSTRTTRQRPVSYVPTIGSVHSAHTDPDTAPSIPIGNLGRSASTRRSRPQSDQFTGAVSLVSQMYRGPDGPATPPSATCDTRTPSRRRACREAPTPPRAPPAGVRRQPRVTSRA